MLHHPCILGGPQQREQNRKSKPMPGVTMMHHATNRGFKDCPKCAPLAHPLKGHRWGTGPKRCPARARRANVPPEFCVPPTAVACNTVGATGCSVLRRDNAVLVGRSMRLGRACGLWGSTWGNAGEHATDPHHVSQTGLKAAHMPGGLGPLRGLHAPPTLVPCAFMHCHPLNTTQHKASFTAPSSTDLKSCFCATPCLCQLMFSVCEPLGGFCFRCKMQTNDRSFSFLFSPFPTASHRWATLYH